MLAVMMAVAIVPVAGRSPASRADAAPNSVDTTTKLAYKVNADGSTTPLTNPDGTPVANQPVLTSGDKITFVVQDSRKATKNDTQPRTLTDTMSANLQYVPGSLTKLNGTDQNGNALYSGLTIKEPSSTSWSGGQQIATFNPTTGKYQYAPNGMTPIAQPVFGQNAQYVEASSTGALASSTSNGDGFNPTFIKNAAGQLIVWSITHHNNDGLYGYETIGCQLVGTHESCSSVQNFWGTGIGTYQDVNTISLGTKGYMPLVSESADSYYVGCLDFANVAPGVAPTKCSGPVQVLGGANNAFVNHGASGLFLSGGKIYIIGTAMSSSPTGHTDLLLGCYDPATNAVCTGFSPTGNRVSVNTSYNGGNVGGMLFRSEIWLPNGAFQWTTDFGGQASFCVVPSGATLVNCSGATGAITPVTTGNSYMSVPIVSADSNTTVPMYTGTDTQQQDRTRVTGWCVGATGAIASKCFDLTGKSIGMPYPGLQMQYTGNSRLHNGFGMPAGQAQVIYALDYNNSEATCYDFALKALCTKTPQTTNPYTGQQSTSYSTTRTGVTWVDWTQTDGRIYGARMVPGTQNCMVTLGDASTFLYYKVDASGRVWDDQNMSGCNPVSVAFQDPSTRYCGPTAGQAGVKQWDTLQLTEQTASTKAAKNVDTNVVLGYYAYDPATGLQGAKLGSVTVPGGGASATITPPSFLDYSTVKSFMIVIAKPAGNTTYQFTQFNTADSNPAVCYQATVAPKCVATTETTTNTASWSKAANETTQLSATVTLTLTYDGKCIEMSKTSSGVTGPVGGQYTSRYTVTVTNTAVIDTTYGPITDTPQFTTGTTITGASYTKNGGASTPLTGAGPYSLGGSGTSIAAGATDTYVVMITFTMDTAPAGTVTDCAGTPTPGQGLYNAASVPGDKTLTNNDACNQPPGTPQFQVRKDLASGQTGPLVITGTTWTVSYDVTLTNAGTAAGTSPAVTDTPSVPAGFTVTSVSVGGTQASGSAPYQITAGVDLAPGQAKTYTVVLSGTVDPATADWSSVGRCDTTIAGDPKLGLFNKVAMTGDGDGVNNNDACRAATAFEVAKKADGGAYGGTGASVMVRPDGTVTVRYTVAVTNIGGASSIAPAVTDTLTLPAGFSVTSVTLDGAAQTLVGGSFTIPAGTTPLAGGDARYAVIVVNGRAADLASVSWLTAGTCSTTGAGSPGSGFFNQVSMVGDIDGAADNDACVPVTRPMLVIHLQKFGVNCDTNAATCPVAGAAFSVYDNDPQVARTAALGSMMVDTPADPATYPVGSTFSSMPLELGARYWLVETKAPSGLQLLATPIVFTVTADGIQLDPAQPNGATVAVSSTDTFTLKVTDQTTGALPEAGGSGPWRSMGFGTTLVLIGGAWVALGSMRRRRPRHP